jgi:hypothetical protein
VGSKTKSTTETQRHGEKKKSGSSDVLFLISLINVESQQRRSKLAASS